MSQVAAGGRGWELRKVAESCVGLLVALSAATESDERGGYTLD